MKEKKSKPILPICILGVIIIAIIVIVILLMNSNETHTSETETSTKQEILQCSTSTPTDPFFNTNKNVTGVNYNIKYLYEDNKIQSASFNYVATFDSEAIAKNELSNMQYQFYQYVANTSADGGALDPNFNKYTSDVSIGLFFDKKYLIPSVSKLLFLDDTEALKLQKYSIEDLEKIYRNKKFSCKHNEYNNQN